MLTPLAPGSSVKPIISVGDTVRGYRFEAIPDGIAFTPNGRGTMDVYVNHETSLVPFPANRSDFTNSLVSKLRLNQHSAGVLRGEYVICERRELPALLLELPRRPCPRVRA